MTIIAVFLGGVLGTGLRLGLDTLLPHEAAGFPWSTLIANVTGSFLLGLMVARLPRNAPRWLRAGLGTGALGGYTTFSALAVSLVAMTDAGSWALAAGYLAISLILGIAAGMAGLALGPGRRHVPVVSEDE